MGSVSDVKHTLDSLEPKPGQSAESFAQEGLRWQNEVYSSNAGSDLDITWDTISLDQRKSWLAWAKKKMAAQ